MKRLTIAAGVALALTTTAQADDFDQLLERMTIGAVAADKICAETADRSECYSRVFEGVGVTGDDVKMVLARFDHEDPALQRATASTIINLVQ